MTLPQVYDQFKYWEQNPPVHELVAMYMEYKPPVSAEEQIANGDAMGPAEFHRHFQQTGGKLSG